MNTYRYTFIAACPGNGEQIVYTLELRHTQKVLVEHIKTACALHKQGHQEDIAADLHTRFGGHLTLRAAHHGVDIETVLAAPIQAQAYSIDADPQGIRARVADAITGALGLGAQGSGTPPPDHWLTPFWQMARADATQAREDALGAMRLQGLLIRMVDQLEDKSRPTSSNAPYHGHSIPGVWDSDNGAKAGTKCAWCELWAEAVAVRDAARAAQGGAA